MTTLLLIRHGQTDWNLAGRYTGQTDIRLNPTGRAQAERAADALQADPPDIIVCSDLSRARETAETIARRCGRPVHSDPRLREIDQGEWEGLHFDEIKSRYAEEFARRKADPLRVAPPGGETVGQVRARVLEAVADITRAHAGESIAVVSHGLALALIRAHFSHAPVDKVWELIPPNATVERIEIDTARVST